MNNSCKVNTKTKTMYNLINTSRFYLMGLEFNDVWKHPDFYINVTDGLLCTADDIDEATILDYNDAMRLKDLLQVDFSDYTWYLVIVNNKQ